MNIPSVLAIYSYSSVYSINKIILIMTTIVVSKSIFEVQLSNKKLLL